MTPHTRRVATALTALLSTALLTAPALGAPGSSATLAISNTITSATPDAPETTDGQLLLVLDASGSMQDDDGAGTPKIEAARSALGSVIDGLADDQRVGLRMFASTESESDTAAACADSELVVPVGTGNQGDLSAAVDDYEPFGGETPIGYALQEAGKDLGSEGQRSILLVSDGLSTCDPDPCEVAEDLTEDGIDLSIHVVGLDVDSEARAQLQCIAEAGNGSYIDAADTESLTSALTQVSTRAFRPFSIAGEPVEGTPTAPPAPVLGVGQFTDTMPLNEESAKFYRLQRTVPGSTLHVGITSRPESGGLGSYRMGLETTEGDSCGTNHALAWSAAAGNSFGTTAVNTSLNAAAHKECQQDDEIILRLVLQPGSPGLQEAPFEMVVSEELPVTNASTLPGSSVIPSWDEIELGTPTGEIVGGSSLNDAPRIEPGQTYTSELTRDEIVFFRVPVDYGQRLQALVEFPKPTGLFAETTGPVSDVADVLIIGPTRGEATAKLANLGDLSERAVIQEEHAVRAAATTYEVRWANRAARAASANVIAGDYWVGVSMTSNDEVRPPIPFTLTTETIGEPSGFPEYAEASAADDLTEETAPAEETQTDDSAATAAPDTAAQDEASATGPDTAAAPPVETPDDGASAGLILGLAALGLALLGAGGFVLAKVMRT